MATKFSRADLRANLGTIVRLAGQPIGYEIEPNRDARRIDHLMIRLRAGTAGLAEISLNTWSLRNLRRNRDPRVRIALLPSAWEMLPAAGIFSDDVEAEKKIAYRKCERPALEELLIGKIKRAVFVEGWGELYLRSRSGIHQVHSRSREGGSAQGVPDRDGAVRFYFSGNTSELLLSKFFGQV